MKNLIAEKYFEMVSGKPVNEAIDDQAEYDAFVPKTTPHDHNDQAYMSAHGGSMSNVLKAEAELETAVLRVVAGQYTPDSLYAMILDKAKTDEQFGGLVESIPEVVKKKIVMKVLTKLRRLS